MSVLETPRVTIATGDEIQVRSFAIKQGMSRLFSIELRVLSPNHDIDFDGVTGKAASMTLPTHRATPSWHGICTQIDQVRVDTKGLATYSLTIAPSAWLMTQRRNYRVFQMESELDIVKKMLGEWNIAHEARVDASRYKPRKYRVQYDESDFDFVSRNLEEAGISYFFEEKDGSTVMVLDDAPHARELTKPLISYFDTPGVSEVDFVTRVAVTQRVRPGKVTIGDLDYRKQASAQPRFSAAGGLPQEANLEQFLYEPGRFLFKQDSPGGSTPTADDRGGSRTDDGLANQRTTSRLRSTRSNARRITFESNMMDLVPGTIMSVVNHPHRALGIGTGLLVIESLLEGEHDDDWRAHCEVVSTAEPVFPEMRTPRPRVPGLESATVVGPASEDIHTDEYGRVRVQFHWDREGKRDETASCWVPSSQPWAGAQFGGVNLPRIGQEVIVEFLGADPDRPVVVGRVYTETQGSPYKLPKYKNVMTLRSETTPRMVTGASGDGGVSAGETILGEGTPYGASEINGHVTGSGPFNAKTPNGMTHQWSGSEFSMDDTAGSQITYFQAQKDYNELIKDASTSVVGNHRACTIGSDDILNIENKQQIDIGKDQVLTIGRDQKITVGGDVTENITGHYDQTVGKGIGITSEAFIIQQAKGGIVVSSEHRITLKVGRSEIVISDEEIVIQSGDKVQINPRQGQEEQQAKDDKRAEAIEKLRQYRRDQLAKGGMTGHLIDDRRARDIMEQGGITDWGEQQKVADQVMKELPKW
jgi:type VI secretion system secreted protein VgrG